MAEIKLNSKGTNAAIKGHILPAAEMRAIGFTDHDGANWYFCRSVGKAITFNCTIPKDGGDVEIITLDELFCQPYDYQYILETSPRHKIANAVRDKVEDYMELLQHGGAISGHVKGAYI